MLAEDDNTNEEAAGKSAGMPSGNGLNEWMIFEKPDGNGRVALWPSAIVGIEEFKPVVKKTEGLDVFIHSRDFNDPVPVKGSFEEVVERTHKAWSEEDGDVRAAHNEEE